MVFCFPSWSPFNNVWIDFSNHLPISYNFHHHLKAILHCHTRLHSSFPILQVKIFCALLKIGCPTIIMRKKSIRCASCFKLIWLLIRYERTRTKFLLAPFSLSICIWRNNKNCLHNCLSLPSLATVPSGITPQREATQECVNHFVCYYCRAFVGKLV